VSRASKCEREVVVEHGFLRFYCPASGKRFIVAHCGMHLSCRLTRTLLGSERQGREGQGRPIGLALAWLQEHHKYISGHDHVHTAEMPSFEARRQARENGKEIPEVQWLMDNAERPQRDGEEEEPQTVP